MKKYYLIILISVLMMDTSCDVKQNNESRLAIFQRIDQEITQNSKAYSTLEEATSSIGHRLTGSENGRKAEEYTYKKFKEYGFDSVEYVDFEVESWSRGEIATTLDDGTRIPSVSLAHSPINVDLTGSLVDLGNGLEMDYMANPNAVKNKIALVYLGILGGSPKNLINLHRSEKTSLAIKYGAIGIIVFNQVKNGVLLTGTASVTGAILPIPAICIGKEDGTLLREQIKMKNVQAHIVMTNYSGPIKVRNIMATIKGSEIPKERIIIGGHLDSWDLATGAIDNGIGSFSVLDIARSFKANNLHPRRTIQFVLFMGEEQGLFGSRYMVKTEIKNGTIDQIKYVMNMDMSGNPIGITAGGQLDNKGFFVALGEEIRSIDSVFTNEFTNKATLHSDHQPFMLEGIPYIELISNLDQSAYDCYHADCDSFDLIDKTHITNNVRFGTMIAYALADATQLPAKKMNSETTKQFMIDSDLQEPLTIAGDWKWDKETDVLQNEAKKNNID